MKRKMISLFVVLAISLVSASQNGHSDDVDDNTPIRNSCAPLLQSIWGEKESNDGYDNNAYNANTPSFNGCLAPAGSAAVAMGQLIYYWHYPFFMTNNGSLFNWCQMSDELTTSSPCYEENKKHVSLLLAECGHAAHMNYSCSMSSTTPSDVKNALEQYFHFHVASEFQNVIPEPVDPGPLFGADSPEQIEYHFQLGLYEEFKDLIISCLDHGQPILCVDENYHFCICDGYRTSNGFQVHLNLGVANASINGYFTLNDISDYMMLMEIYPAVNYAHESIVNLSSFYYSYYTGFIPPYQFVPGDADVLISASSQSPQSWRTIPPYTKSIYQAYGEIILTDGFEALSGSDFTAQIISCCENTTRESMDDETFDETGNSLGELYSNMQLQPSPTDALFPNPTDGPLTMSIDGTVESILIFNTAGNPMGGWRIESMTDQSFTLDVSPLPSGIYLLSVTTSGDTRTERFIRR